MKKIIVALFMIVLQISLLNISFATNIISNDLSNDYFSVSAEDYTFSYADGLYTFKLKNDSSDGISDMIAVLVEEKHDSWVEFMKEQKEDPEARKEQLDFTMQQLKTTYDKEFGTDVKVELISDGIGKFKGYETIDCKIKVTTGKVNFIMEQRVFMSESNIYAFTFAYNGNPLERKAWFDSFEVKESEVNKNDEYVSTKDDKESWLTITRTEKDEDADIMEVDTITYGDSVDSFDKIFSVMIYIIEVIGGLIFIIAILMMFNTKQSTEFNIDNDDDGPIKKS